MANRAPANWAPVSGFLGVDLRRLPSVLSGSAFVQALKNTRSKLQAVVDLERERK